MEYKVFPFIITNYEKTSVIQNSLNTVIVKDEQMICFFNWVDSNSVYNVSKDHLIRIFKEETCEAIEFMKFNHLIDEVNEKNIKFKNVTVVSNDEVFINSVKFNSDGHSEKFIYELLPMDFNEFKITNPQNLYLFFLNPFNYKYYSELVNVIRNNNILSRFGFYYNHSLLLSNYYKKEWCNPCPLCFFGNIESSLRGMYKGSTAVSFLTLLDLIYKKDPGFVIKNTFSNYSISMFVNTILNDIVITDHSHINNVKYIDFNKNIVLLDQAIHWELCDCYE
ncbi:McbB family protein [Clostridium algidicarnis]|uniref:McbB family protein n=1 Tax=Clostridium algidicarnis TaxID=37659 RepID=UPI001C0C1C8B|nr:McbB family protein [Clostridium algidicarnis]MBU3228910.1 McbB family protein [Clostridium algidicarnis]MBU3252454.1 McbB family protein [Clostridium algidicarnis]